MPEIRQRAPTSIQLENCAANTPAKSPFGTLRMPSGALFSSSTLPALSSRAPRSELVPQSTAIRSATLAPSVAGAPLRHAAHEALAGCDLRGEDELVGLVRLGDVARPAHHGRHAERLLEDAGLGAVDDAAHGIGARPVGSQRLGLVVALGREADGRGAHDGLDLGRWVLGLHL